MALIISDRVKETTITEGTGSLTLSGATFGGFQTFSSAIGNGNTTYYCIQNGDRFEIGIGTFSSGLLSRDTVLQSSDSDSKISLTGASTVFCVIPADRIVYKDADNAVVFPTPFIFKRSDNGDYWQAFSTDYGSRVVSFFLKEGFDPEWKIGLKTSASDSIEPYYGYISAKEGFVELNGSSLASLEVGDANEEGFKISHQLTTIIHLKENGGEIFVDSLNIKNADISQDVLSIEGGVGHVANLQTWNVSTTEKASVDAEGNFNTLGNVSGVTGIFSAVNFADGTIQTSAALPSSSGYLIDQNAANIVAVSGLAATGGDVTTTELNYVSGIAVYGSGQAVANQADILAVSGWAESYVNSQDHSAVAVSGWAEATFLTQDDDSYVSGIATYASGLADQNVLDIATVSGLLSDSYDDTPISGYFESRVDTNESQITAVSGWAESYVDSQDHSAVAVSGWARDYVDSQDHSALSVSGALQPQITQNTSDIVTVSGIAVNSTPDPSGMQFIVGGGDNQYRINTIFIDADGTEQTVRTASINGDGLFQLEVAQFSPSVSANGQSRYWDQPVSQWTVSVDNPSDFTTNYVNSVKSTLTSVVGSVTSDVSLYSTTGPSATPRGGVDWTQTFTVDGDSPIYSSTSDLSGGSASATVSFLDKDNSTISETASISFSWQSASSSISFNNLTGNNFLQSYSSVGYNLTITGLSNSSNASTTITTGQGTLSNSSDDGTMTFTTSIHKDNNSGRTITATTDFTRPSTVTGAEYTTQRVVSDSSISASFTYPSFYIFTTSKSNPPSRADIVDTNDFDSSVVTELGNQVKTIDGYITNSDSVPKAWWFAVRSSASQPTTFKTGNDSSLLSTLSSEDITETTVDLEPDSPAAGYVAEGYNLYGITLNPGNTYVQIS